MYLHKHIYAIIIAIIINTKRGINVKESEEGDMGVFGGREK